jgi:N-acetylneuraminate synthase
MSEFSIDGRAIGPEEPAYVVAELSANHRNELDHAMELLEAAVEAGADAVKIQTYRPDTLTIDADTDYFTISDGTPWDGQTLYELYEKGYMPWQWQPKLKARADELGVDLFSSAFDSSAVEFLEEMDVPAYKVASFENVDLPLIRRMAETGKPLIISTGMASVDEIADAVTAARESGADGVSLLKCTSSYPAPADSMNVTTIPHMADLFDVPTGLSDHSPGIGAAVAAVAHGGSIIEKHFTLSRDEDTPDADFSLEPDEFERMVDSIRQAEQSLGGIEYGMHPVEETNEVFRRSLFCVEDVEAGERLTEKTVQSIRPGYGIKPKHIDVVLGRRAAEDISRGEPLRWDLID